MERKRRTRHRVEELLRVSLAWWVLVLAALAPALVPARANAAGLLVADGGFGGVLEIVSHEVKVTINNGIAVTEVTQVFRNTENRVVEALYTFPVPRGASVSNFSMWINGAEMVGEVVEKERARQIYQSYKQTRKDPGLLEQTDYKTFEMRIFPIAAGAEQRVQIAYYQELDSDHDWVTYVYPLATVARQGVDNRVQGSFSMSFQARSEVPIAVMESPSHKSDFLSTAYTENYVEASMEKRDGDLARDVVLSYRTSRPVTGVDLIASREGKEDGYFCLTLTAGEELAALKTGSDFIFVLDVSGSMQNEAKLTTSRESIEAFVESLGPEDRFEIMTFNREARALFGALTPVGEESRRRASEFLRSREAKGGTSLKPALSAAYRYADPDRSLNTVILSDGMTEQDESRELMEMIRTRPANVLVFCVGVGNEINRPLLTRMAEDAGGLAAFLSRDDDFDRQAKAFYRKLQHPAVTDLELKVTGVEVYDLEPRELPNLYHGMPIRLYGRYRKGGRAGVVVSGAVAGKSTRSEVELTFPAADGGNPEIERMWAWRKLRDLQDQVEAGGDRKLTEEIVRLGEAYSIASEYTSFIVLENDAEYKRWTIERRNALRIGRDRKAQEKTRKELEKLRAEAAQGIGPAAVNKDESLKAQQGTQTAAAPRPAPPPAPGASSSSGRSANLPGFGGGGAVDPLGGLAALALAGAALARRRRRRH